MVDFQFLPMEKKADGGGYESLLDQLIPPTMPSLDWLKEETPVFILPQVFSRLDTPAVQPLRDEPKRRVMPGRPSGRPDNVLGGSEQQFPGHLFRHRTCFVGQILRENCCEGLRRYGTPCMVPCGAVTSQGYRGAV